MEAVDNAKFLRAIEKYCHPIYIENPANMKAHIRRLLNIVRMIQNVSSFYNSPERIASLIVKISNQVTLLERSRGPTNNNPNAS